MSDAVTAREQFSYRQRRRVSVFVLLIIVGCISFGVLTPIAQAAEYNEEAATELADELVKTINAISLGVGITYDRSQLQELVTRSGCFDWKADAADEIHEYILNKDIDGLKAYASYLVVIITQQTDKVILESQNKINAYSKFGTSGFSINWIFDSSEFTVNDSVSAYASLYYATNAASTLKTVKSIINSGFYQTIVIGDENHPTPANAIMNGIKAVALGFTIVYGFIHAFKVFARGELNLDMGVKMIIVFVLSFLMVTYVDEMLTVVDDLGSSVLNMATADIEASVELNTQSGAETIAQNIVNEYEEKQNGGVLGFFQGVWDGIQNLKESILTMLQSGSGLLVMKISLQFLIYAIAGACFGLYISFCLRRAFMPLAVADVVAEGMRSPGIDYIKTYFSLYLEAAYFVLIAAITTMMESYAYAFPDMSSQTNTVFGSFGAVVCIRGAATMALRKSSEFARAVVGTR